MALVRNHPNYPKFRMKTGFMMDFSGSAWIYQEEPAGVMNGENANFRLTKRPTQNTEEVFKDGMLMARGLDYEMDYVNQIVRFVGDSTQEVLVKGVLTKIPKKGQIPQYDSVIRVNYKYELE